MIRFSRFSALAAAICMIAAVPALSAPKVDFSKRYSMSATGGYVIGNPDAKTSLVEYVSYTCTHCAHFTQEATAPLEVNWLKPGRISIEIRNAVRDRYDLTAALLARCGGPTRFYGNHLALFANFDNWMKQVVAYEQKSGESPPANIEAAMNDIASATGLYALMEKRGFTQAQLKTCLGDMDARKKVLAMTQEAWEGLKIGGTPSFAVNGKLVDDAHDWQSLQPALPLMGK